jgi:glutamate racemase
VIKEVYIVYDSGVGGLTVLKEILEKNIKANFVYIGDTKNAPYGNKTENQIKEFVRMNIEIIKLKYKINGIIMACNTAAIIAKEYIETEMGIKVFPISEISKRLSVDGKTLILTTEATKKSGYFESQFATVKSCPSFVPMIESYKYNFKELREEVVYLELSDVIDGHNKIILGCTHFPYLKEEIEKLFGKEKEIINPAKIFVELIENNIKQTYFSLEFIVTGEKKYFENFMKEMLGWENELGEIEEWKQKIG